MAKLDDLNLGESGPSPVDELARSTKAFERFREEVDRLLEEGEHDFAWGYLKDLSLTLARTGRHTSAQVEAVNNIKAGKERHEEQLARWNSRGQTGSRRYEGFEGRGR